MVMTTAPAAAPAGRDATVQPAAVPATPVGHRPALDGLRAVAVYLVVLFHAGSSRFSGGFVGVDVFFVLSGYLVTQLLMRDLASTGAIRLSRFYARRFRRLLPASFLALVGTAVVITAVLTPAEVVEAVDSFQAASLYWANWHFVRESADYFGDQVGRDPVLHFWSLAVEEQFYVLWPLLLTAVVWVATKVSATRRWAVARVLVGAGAVASLVWALSLSGSSPDRAYYGTDTRAYQLLAGALIALTPGLVTRARRLAPVVAPLTWAALATLLVLASWVIRVTPVQRGVAVCVVAGVLIVGLERGSTGLLSRALSRPTLAYLGTVSYGTYLWHWPVIIVVEELTDVGPLAVAATSAVLATGLAALSFVLVEVPIRRASVLDRLRPAVIGGGLAISVLAAAVVIPAVMQPSSSRPADASTAPDADHLTPVPADFDQVALYEAGYGKPVSCLGKAVTECTVRTGSGPHVLLLGDSNAVSMIEAFRAVAEQEDLTLSLGAQHGCSWVRDWFRPADEAEQRTRCTGVTEDLYDRVIPGLEPDIVVAMDVRSGRSLGHPDFEDRPENAENREHVLDAVEQLTADGQKLVIIEPLPRDPLNGDPLKCLERASFAETCRFTAPTDSFWLEELERELAAEDDQVWTIDLDRAACPLLPTCDAVIGDAVVWWDAAHLAPDHSQTLDDDLVAAFRLAGLVPTT